MPPRRGRDLMSGSGGRNPPPLAPAPDPGAAATASSGARIPYQFPPARGEDGGGRGAGILGAPPGARNPYQIPPARGQDGGGRGAARGILGASPGARILNRPPPARGEHGGPLAPIPVPAAPSSRRFYQPLGSTVSPNDFQIGYMLIGEAMTNTDADCGPATPSQTHEKRVPRARSSRHMVRRSGSPSPQASSSAINSEIPSAKEEKQNFDQQKRAFRAYMDTFCVQMAAEMWEAKSFSLCIDYDELKRVNTQLAYDIANNMKGIKDSLHAAAREFLHQQFSLKESDGRFSSVEMLGHSIKHSTELHFSWMPKSIMSLEDFLKKHKTQTRKLFAAHAKCKHRVALLPPAARNMLGEVVTYITSSHKKGLAWNGNWKISDWDVYNGSSLHLRSTAMDLVGRSMCHKDLETISSEIIPKLTHNGEVGGMYPAYLRDLYQQLKTKETSAISDTDFNTWFYEYLQYHPALLSSRARAALIKGLYGIAVRLDYNKNTDFDVIFKDNNFVGGWIKFVFKDRRNIHEILWMVFWDNKFPDETTDPNTWCRPYKSVAGDLLKMVRHVIVHANRYTRTSSDGQAMKHNVEPELFAADMYKGFLPELIKLIFKKGKMHGEFAAEWEFYKASKDFGVEEMP